MFYNPDKKITSHLLILIGSEFLIASTFILGLDKDLSKLTNLRYSGIQWLITLFAITCGVMCIILTRTIYVDRIYGQIQNLIRRNSTASIFISIVLFFWAGIAILIPSGYLGNYWPYFQRLRPLLIVLAVIPFQFLAPIIFRSNNKTGLGIKKPFLIALAIMFILSEVIVGTKFGIEPDSHFWNVAGVPFTFLDLAIVLLITIAFSYGLDQISIKLKVSSKTIDILIALVIYLVGTWLWSHIHMVKHFFALRPATPSFQYIPYSDARDHDLGALSILQGYGINFGEYTDKPLYITFLAILHLFSGNDYNRLSMMHLACMGVILPAAFWFGKNFHSRHFGIALALILLIRQRNAILLAHLLAGTNPRLLLTEIPTMLGMILFLNITFSWFKDEADHKRIWSFAFLAGGILAAISLFRLNPLGLLPVILTIIFIKFRKPNKRWISQFLAFTLGFLIVFTPWLLSGQDSNGQPYIWIKIQDVINVRYSATHVQPEEAFSKHIKTRAKFQSSKLQNVTITMDDHSVEEFPIFIINHSLHNFVTAFLALPDSLSPQDQDLKILIKRPYFDEKQLMAWNGSLRPGQYVFVVLNIVLISIGLGWAWQRWRWMGILPAIIFVTYTITLGLARSSGSRYIVPVDWIVFLYYLLGIFLVIEKFFTDSVIPPNENKYIKKNPIPPFTLTIVNISIVVFLAVLIPIAQIPIITKNPPTCENRVINRQYQDAKLLKGRALYPYLEKGSLTFVFLSCTQRIEINISEFSSIPKPGQTIIVGFKKHQPTIIFLEEKPDLITIWQAK